MRTFLQRIMMAAAFAIVLPAGALAQGISLNASVDQARVEVGSVLVYSLEVSGVSQNARPTMPDFGGLQVVGGPFLHLQQMDINGSRNVSTQFRWQLRAPQQGTFTIGQSQLEYNGQVFKSRPITVTVTLQPPPKLPDDLKDEGIISPRTNNDAVNKQLDGRLFLRATVSDRSPYVSEPVLITYSLYWDRIPLQGLQYPNEPVKVSSGLVEEKYQAKGDINPVAEQHGERTYQVAPIYQFAVTPTEPGDMNIGGYYVVAQLPVQRQSNRDPFDDPFFADPFRSNTIQVQIPAAALRLNVRALPSDGVPAGFSGTVGTFTLKSSVDRATMRQDELLTLDVTLDGKGAVDLASPPHLPDNDDFDLVDQTANVDQTRPKDYPGGTKHFQFTLRPRKFGALTIPAISYPIFDTDREAYRNLTTEPVMVTVQPVPGGVAAAATPAAGKAAQKTSDDPQLNFLQPIDALRPGLIEPAAESPLMLGLLIGGSFLFAGLALRDWRRARLDPAAVRRSGAWRRFEKRLKSIQHQAGSGHAAEAAGAFEHAVRNVIADHFNISAEGLTRDEIAQILSETNLSREQIAKLLERLDACAWASYSPVSAPVDIRAWSDETRTMLREGLRA